MIKYDCNTGWEFPYQVTVFLFASFCFIIYNAKKRREMISRNV